jgi:hypothetical protein
VFPLTGRTKKPDRLLSGTPADGSHQHDRFTWCVDYTSMLSSRSQPFRQPQYGSSCLVPRWADLGHHLMQEHAVVLIVQATSGTGLRWLQIQGTARPLEAPACDKLLPRWASTLQPDAIYLVVRVTLSRIDLVDEDLGWGVQETLEW